MPACCLLPYAVSPPSPLIAAIMRLSPPFSPPHSCVFSLTYAAIEIFRRHYAILRHAFIQLRATMMLVVCFHGFRVDAADVTPDAVFSPPRYFCCYYAKIYAIKDAICYAGVEPPFTPLTLLMLLRDARLMRAVDGYCCSAARCANFFRYIYVMFADSVAYAMIASVRYAPPPLR